MSTLKEASWPGSTYIDDGVSRAGEQQLLVLRQAQAEHAALVRLDDLLALVRIEAVDLGGVSPSGSRAPFFHRTKISPPCVPAKMYCEDTARARIDLSCFMRWDRAGVRLSRGTPSPKPLLLDVLLPWLGGSVMDIVSQASPDCVCGASRRRPWDACRRRLR